LTVTVVIVLGLALGIGLVFHWLYPRVTLTGELYGLFVFVALVLRLGLSKLAARQKPRTSAGREADK
jgi:hypothetical protein